MTAAGLDYLSDGRAMLGLGASGPQVIEGFHGVPYDAPLARLRETIEICRQVWRREKVRHTGKKYEVPLGQDKGTGLAKPLKLINHPVRDEIPIALATLGADLRLHLPENEPEGWILEAPERALRVVLGREHLFERFDRLAELLRADLPALDEPVRIDLRFADQAVLQELTASG